MRAGSPYWTNIVVDYYLRLVRKMWLYLLLDLIVPAGVFDGTEHDTAKASGHKPCHNSITSIILQCL